MPPDPIGTRPSSSLVIGSPEEGNETSQVETGWYDRSSLEGDFTVMIDGQTEAEYLKRAPDRRFCEYIDGIVYMPPRVRPEHQSDVQFLLFLIAGFNARRPIGVVSTGPVALKLRDDCFLEPDLFVMPIGCEWGGEGAWCQPPVLLVVEVLSPSNRSYDLTQKGALYREAKIQEIWFVDPGNHILICERLEEGVYLADRYNSGPVVSRALPGFWIDAAWLWAEPQPNLLGCLDQILAGLPPE